MKYSLTCCQFQYKDLSDTQNVEINFGGQTNMKTAETSSRPSLRKCLVLNSQQIDLLKVYTKPATFFNVLISAKDIQFLLLASNGLKLSISCRTLLFYFSCDFFFFFFQHQKQIYTAQGKSVIIFKLLNIKSID